MNIPVKDPKIETITKWTVNHLVVQQLKDNIRINYEYQRGIRWTVEQEQMFIDSIFRGYSIPAFYLHKISDSRMDGEDNIIHFIVDGQQRINAISKFTQNKFQLLDPKDEKSKFPNFLKNIECPWGGCYFKDLPSQFQDNLKNCEVVVYEIETDNKNYIRDLFIRLQGGTALTAQEKRDSWPGNFTKFVLRIGGKTRDRKTDDRKTDVEPRRDIGLWPGDSLLFKHLAKTNNQAMRRQLVAQIFMLYWNLQKENKFCDINQKTIDKFYHAHVEFDEKSKEAKRFEEICDKLYKLFQRQPKLYGHYLIHLFLLVDKLSKEYAPEWENRLVEQWKKFESRRQQSAKDDKEKKEPGPYHPNYAQLTHTRPDTSSTIKRRHVFFVEEMLKMLKPKKRDPQRGFTELERQIVFFRDREICQWCKMADQVHPVSWDECHIHHIVPHAQGGLTELDNAALMHRDCHPQKDEKVSEFKALWDEFHSTKKAQDTA